MNAVNATRSQKLGRTVLHEVLPAETPFLLGIFTGDVCNFKCRYCIQSVADTVSEKTVLKRQFLEWSTFVRIAESAMQFPQRIKTVLFSSIGEPLLHPDIVDMLAFLKSREVADHYEIVTNASMLTPDLTRALVDSGLTRLCVSLQGLNSKKCGYSIDYDKFYQNLKYFYEYSRGKCLLHIKTVDMSLEDGEEEMFYDIYGAICDTIHIDAVVPAFQGVDYTSLVKTMDAFSPTMYQIYETTCCSPVFYTLYTLADGTIAPCCDSPQPLTYGHINDIGLVEAWNSKKRKKFLLQHLEHERCNNPVCKRCTVPLRRQFNEDVLDGHEAIIRRRLLENEE